MTKGLYRPPSGRRALHLATRLDGTRCLLASQQLDRLETLVGVVGLELGVLRDDRNGERHQRLMVLGTHLDRAHRGVDRDLFHGESQRLDAELVAWLGLER